MAHKLKLCLDMLEIDSRDLSIDFNYIDHFIFNRIIKISSITNIQIQ